MGTISGPFHKSVVFVVTNRSSDNSEHSFHLGLPKHLSLSSIPTLSELLKPNQAAFSVYCHCSLIATGI